MFQLRDQQLPFNDNPGFDKANGSEVVLVSVPLERELERTTDVGAFRPTAQEHQPEMFSLCIMGNTQVHPKTADPIHG